MKTRLYLLLSLFAVGWLSGFSQQYTYNHDKQKFYQLRSMENPEEWKFAPDWYYYITHKKYSGAHWKWKWNGFKSGPVIEFREEDSSVGRCYTERLAQIFAEEDNLKKTKQELDTITPIHAEELLRFADRNIDAMYAMYKDDFHELQATISDNLNYCLEKSKGKLIEPVEFLQSKIQCLLEEIDYIHKNGIGFELENSKRQIAYDEALKKMEELCSYTANLVFYSKCYY